MRRKVFLWLSVAVLIFALFLQWVRLPLAQGDMWMSPDETAVATAAATFATSRTFLFPVILPNEFAWVHPRSWVFLSGPNMLAPVGFLGMPAILSAVYGTLGVLGLNLFTPLLALMTLLALWQILPKGWSKAAKLTTLLVWMAFPAVVLYANRGLFAQLPVICLAIWMWWGITTSPQAANDRGRPWRRLSGIIIRTFIAGLSLGLAAAIRPTELPWLVPVAVFAFLWRGSPMNVTANHQDGLRKLRWVWLAFVVPCVGILMGAAWLGHQTYGNWGVSGYQIRVDENSLVQKATSTTPVVSSVSLLQTLPFDFHPRNIWWNASRYYGHIMWPWLLVALMALAWSIYGLFKERGGKDGQRIEWKRLMRWDIAAVLWPTAWTMLFYGNGLYQDNIRLGEVSIGNSFIRYTLPASICLALAAGYVFNRMWSHWSMKILAICGTAALVSVGVWTALARDAEGVLANAQELVRYHEIRSFAKDDFGPSSVIVSERGDKIFFPAMLAVSPMPDDLHLLMLLSKGHAVGALLTTQDKNGIINWLLRGFYLTPLHVVGNQTLYDVKAL